MKQEGTVKKEKREKRIIYFVSEEIYYASL
jgi:hypothetical protein